MNNKFINSISDSRIGSQGSYQAYSPLHLHSDGSHDGLGRLDDLVSSASKRGFKHMAVTEHGNLSSSIAFTLTAAKYGIKPILGNEIYLEIGGKIFHLTILADGNNGFSNLVKLNNIGAKGTAKRGAVTLDNLIKYNDGLVVLSGCPVSPMQSLTWNESKSIALKLHNVFQERFFAEMMITTNGSLPSWDRSIQLSQELDIPLVFTNDTHFLNKEDADLHLAFQNMKSYSRFSYDSKMLWLVTEQDMRQRVDNMGYGNYLKDYLEIGMANSFLLADMIDTVTFSSVPKLPHIVDADKKLEAKVWNAFSETSMLLDAEAQARIKHELNVIITKGYATYFLIVEDLITNARNSNVLIGPGRGSAVGSLVAFLLGITEVNPLDYDLFFERFLNPNREAMPDIDTDIPASQRSVVLDYAARKYNAVGIATQIRQSEKILIRDICRHFRTTMDDMNKAAEEGIEGDTWKKLSRVHGSVFNRLYDVMLNQNRHQGKHAGGIIIAEDVDIPLARMKDGTLATSWTEGQNAELSKAGVVKFDMLGLSSLDVLVELKEMTGVDAYCPENLHELDGLPEFDLVKQGKVLGIFQLTGSDGMKNYAQKIAPTNINDIIATVSLWRTGPIRAGATELFLEARHGHPRLIHPEVDELLKATYGLIVYQEDFMRLYAWATGRDLSDADDARRVIVKFKPEKIESVQALNNLEAEFVNGAAAHGLDLVDANKLWSEIVTHTGYSFNKSHATAYSMITWKMLWYKYHYPAEFYCSLLNHDPDRTQEYIFDIVDEGFEISLPDINKSTDRYTTDGKTIYVPLTAIKFLGENGVREILDNRPFTSSQDYMKKVAKRKVTKRSRVNLYQLGAFNNLGGDLADYDISVLDLLRIRDLPKCKKLITKYYGKSRAFYNILSQEHNVAKVQHFVDNNPIDGSFINFLIEFAPFLDYKESVLNMLSYEFALGDHTTLLNKVIHLSKFTSDRRQANYLGLVIPTKERVIKIKEQIANGGTGGVVTEIINKISSWNSRPFQTIVLYPGRNTWTPDSHDLNVGDWVIASINRKTGRLARSEKI